MAAASASSPTAAVAAAAATHIAHSPSSAAGSSASTTPTTTPAHRRKGSTAHRRHSGGSGSASGGSIDGDMTAEQMAAALKGSGGHHGTTVEVVGGVKVRKPHVGGSRATGRRRSSLAMALPEGSALTADNVRGAVQRGRRKSLAETAPAETLASTLDTLDDLARRRGVIVAHDESDDDDGKRPEPEVITLSEKELDKAGAWLQHMPGFAVIPAEECKRMARNMTVWKYPSGTFIVREGDVVGEAPEDGAVVDDGDMFFIKKGKCVVTRKYTDDELASVQESRQRDLGNFLLSNAGSLRNMAVAEGFRKQHAQQESKLASVKAQAQRSANARAGTTATAAGKLHGGAEVDVSEVKAIGQERYLVPVTHKYLATLGEGKFFGERATKGRRRAANVVSDGEVIAMTLTRTNQDIFFNVAVTEEIEGVRALRLACTAPPGQRADPQIDRLEVLCREIQFFQPLTRRLLRQLCQLMRYESFEADTVIFQRGDKSDGLYLVISGQVELSVVNLSDPADAKSLRSGAMSLQRAARIVGSNAAQRTRGREGNKTVLDVLTMGDAFGEMALVGDSRRAYTAKATTFTELMCVTKAQYDMVLGQASNMHLRDKLFFMKRLPLFRDPDVADKVDLVRLTSTCTVMEERSYNKDAIIASEGAEWPGVSFIVSGTIRVLKHLEPHDVGVEELDDSVPPQLDVTSVGPGEAFGWYQGSVVAHLTTPLLARPGEHHRSSAAAGPPPKGLTKVSRARGKEKDAGGGADMAMALETGLAQQSVDSSTEEATQAALAAASATNSKSWLGLVAEYTYQAVGPVQVLFLRKGMFERRMPSLIKFKFAEQEVIKRNYRRERVKSLVAARQSERKAIERQFGQKVAPTDFVSPEHLVESTFKAEKRETHAVAAVRKREAARAAAAPRDVPAGSAHVASSGAVKPPLHVVAQQKAKEEAAKAGTVHFSLGDASAGGAAGAPAKGKKMTTGAGGPAAPASVLAAAEKAAADVMAEAAREREAIRRGTKNHDGPRQLTAVEAAAAARVVAAAGQKRLSRPKAVSGQPILRFVAGGVGGTPVVSYSDRLSESPLAQKGASQGTKHRLKMYQQLYKAVQLAPDDPDNPLDEDGMPLPKPRKVHLKASRRVKPVASISSAGARGATSPRKESQSGNGSAASGSKSAAKLPGAGASGGDGVDAGGDSGLASTPGGASGNGRTSPAPLIGMDETDVVFSAAASGRTSPFHGPARRGNYPRRRPLSPPRKKKRDRPSTAHFFGGSSGGLGATGGTSASGAESTPGLDTTQRSGFSVSSRPQPRARSHSHSHSHSHSRSPSPQPRHGSSARFAASGGQTRELQYGQPPPGDLSGTSTIADTAGLSTATLGGAGDDSWFVTPTSQRPSSAPFFRRMGTRSTGGLPLSRKDAAAVPKIARRISAAGIGAMTPLMRQANEVRRNNTRKAEAKARREAAAEAARSPALRPMSAASTVAGGRQRHGPRDPDRHNYVAEFDLNGSAAAGARSRRPDSAGPTPHRHLAASASSASVPVTPVRTGRPRAESAGTPSSAFSQPLYEDNGYVRGAADVPELSLEALGGGPAYPERDYSSGDDGGTTTLSSYYGSRPSTAGAGARRLGHYQHGGYSLPHSSSIPGASDSARARQVHGGAAAAIKARHYGVSMTLLAGRLRRGSGRGQGALSARRRALHAPAR